MVRAKAKARYDSFSIVPLSYLLFFLFTIAVCKRESASGNSCACIDIPFFPIVLSRRFPWKPRHESGRKAIASGMRRNALLDIKPQLRRSSQLIICVKLFVTTEICLANDFVKTNVFILALSNMHRTQS